MTEPPQAQQPDSPPAQMTIGELARRTGMTVRNIRAHQTKGLLPPPEVRGRTGYYGEEHVARIALTREMQADGLNLEAIRRLLENADGNGSEILDFTRALRAPYEDETPEIVEPAELAETWGGGSTLDPKLLQRAEALGILRALPDGRVEVISPRLQRAGGRARRPRYRPRGRAGDRRRPAPPLRAHRRRLRRPLRPPDLGALRPRRPPRGGLAKVREALDQVRPLASSALLAMFQLTMGEATEKASERTLQAAAGKSPPARKKRRRH